MNKPFSPDSREPGRPLEPGSQTAGVSGSPAEAPATPSPGTQTEKRAETGAAEGCSPVPSVAPTFVCPECDGVGYFTERAFHPDDPRCEASWDCEECEGTGEVDYETPEPNYGTLPTMEEVQARITAVFSPLKKPDGFERVEL